NAVEHHVGAECLAQPACFNHHGAWPSSVLQYDSLTGLANRIVNYLISRDNWSIPGGTELVKWYSETTRATARRAGTGAPAVQRTRRVLLSGGGGSCQRDRHRHAGHRHPG